MIGRLDPSAPEARQWLSDELAKADYQDTRSLLERFFSWLQSLLNRATPTSSNPEGYTVPQWLIAALVVLLIAALALLASRVRAERRAAQDSMGPVLGGLDLTSAQFRARGEQALAERRWSDAVLEFTRALARGAADRTLIHDAPSLTAHEIGSALSPVFPADAGEIRRAMDLFDGVCYGGHRASETEALSVRDLDSSLADRRPVLAEAAI